MMKLYKLKSYLAIASDNLDLKIKFGNIKI